MATISVENLNLTGSELLSDEESFLNDLSDENLEKNYGGGTPIAYLAYVGIALAAGRLGYQIGRDDR